MALVPTYLHLMPLAWLIAGWTALWAPPAPQALNPQGLPAPAAASPSAAAPHGDAAPSDPTCATPDALPDVADLDADDPDPPLKDGEEDDEGEGVADAAEHQAPTDPAHAGWHYTADLSDPEVARLWLDQPEALGSISVGFADAGRMINARSFPPGPQWAISAKEVTWTLDEVVDQLTAAIHEVNERNPDTPPLRISHISREDGGYFRPHQSHQTGRDVDLAFYYRTEVPPGWRGRREKLLDLPRCWALIRALTVHADVQTILVDRRIQKLLRAEALRENEDPAWVASLFDGPNRLLRHARRHRDHFHVRFVAARSQEMGRRVQPLLAQRPDQNRTVHRIRNGDTLGHIARRYGSTIRLIRRANHIRGSFIRAGRTLVVPLRGPCTRCPMPPPAVAGPRRGPPGVAMAMATQTAPPLRAGPQAPPQKAPEVSDGAPASPPPPGAADLPFRPGVRPEPM